MKVATQPLDCGAGVIELDIAGAQLPLRVPVDGKRGPKDPLRRSLALGTIR